jgi:hypothetical protein
MSNIFNRLTPLVSRPLPPSEYLADDSAYAWEILRRLRDYRPDSRCCSHHVLGRHGRSVEIISGSQSLTSGLLFR